MNLDFSEELKNDERFYDEFLGDENENNGKIENMEEITVRTNVKEMTDSPESDFDSSATLSKKKSKSKKDKNDDSSFSQKGIAFQSYGKDKEVMRQRISLDTSDAILVKLVSMQTGKTLGEIYSWLINQHRKELLSLINIKQYL